MNYHEKGLSYLLIAAALMSMDSVFIRLSGLQDFAPSLLFGVFSLISMLAVTRWREGKLLPLIKTGGIMLVISGAIMGISGTTFTLAVQKTTVANVLLISSLSPFFSAIFSWVFLRERIKLQTLAAIILSIFGMYIIVRGSLQSGGLVGDMLAILCVIAVSLNFVVWRKYSHLSRSLVVGAGGFFIALFSVGFVQPSDYDIGGVLIMMIMGLLSAPVGRMLMATATRLIPAPEVSLMSQIKIVIAPMVVWAIFGEVPSQATFIGGSLILLAALGHPLLTILMKRKSRLNEEPATT
ncbi:DMT family transporter [uncultured Cohaesibacter sp.]|uniref:DMT family transporter n=1 Tax=uncultured Cohaesibacter sp. TaxID=1002546 RepID=UPI0029C8BE4E|nr:DMT family transporter [uncultured Cohaesibacter sp.]